MRPFHSKWQQVKRRAATLGRALATERRRRYGGSDTGRWRRDDRLLEDWDRRTERLAALIDPRSRVIEFGAGRRVLRHHLPPGCSYTPSDLVSRSGDTLVADLNATPLPDLPEADVAVFGGVLEYLHDVPSVLWHLHSFVPTIVASYVPGGEGQWSWRRNKGWVNDFTEEELKAVFLRGGYRPVHQEEMAERWGRQVLYRLARQNIHLAAVRD